MAQPAKRSPTPPGRAVRARKTTTKTKTLARPARPAALDASLARGIAALAKAEEALTAGVRAAVLRTLKRPNLAATDALDRIGALTEEAIATARARGGDLLLVGRAIARGVVQGVADAGGDVAAAAAAVAASAAGAVSAGGERATLYASRILAGAVEASAVRGRQAASLLEEAGGIVARRLLSAGHATAAMARTLVEEAASLLQKPKAVPALAPPKAARAKRAAPGKKAARAKGTPGRKPAKRATK